MDDIILYNNIAGMLKNPPTLAPRPNFFRFWAFCQHIVDVMKQIPHPGYPQHGWAGMVLQPAIFALINPMPFAPPPNPGLIAIYPQFALQPAMKMIKINSRSKKNYSKCTQTYIKQSTSSAKPMYFHSTKHPPHPDWPDGMQQCQS